MTEAPGDAAPRSAEFVQSLERGLAVIKAFDAEDRALTLSDVARKTGLTRAAARRFLHTLAELGYVRSDGRQFSLRPAVLELGYAYLSGLSLPEVAHPHMEELTARLHESTSISVLDDTSVVYVARVAAKRIMTVGISVGTRFPAHATSMGRVLLAHAPASWLETYLESADLQPTTPLTVTDRDTLRAVLAEVRHDGYAVVDQELELGLRSLAVPLHDPRGRVVAAMNVSTHVSRGSTEDVVRDLLPALRQTATSIEADLRVRP
jgi:IclR family transcriptional regulator, pca regulon regulatory protein